MLRVKLSMPWAGPSASIAQFVGANDNTIGGCRFFVNEDIDDPDIWFVCEDVDVLDTECRLPPARTVFLTAETSWEPNHYAPGTHWADFINQFSRVYSCHDIYRQGVVHSPPFLPWMINANHGRSMYAEHVRDIHALRSITDLPKSRTLSVFCSAQTLTANHRMRLRFVEKLKEHFGETLDWFGNGINPTPEKWTGLAPYRYTLVLENQSTATVFTEKVFDAFLGLAFPIYWGAPNLSDYFDAESFAVINIRDLAGSIARIEEIISSDLAESRRPALLDSKRRVLDEHNMFVRLAAIAREVVADTSGQTPRLTKINSASSFVPGAKPTVVSAVGRGLMRVGSRLTRPPKV